jgi:hypothetical protein
VVSLPGPFPFPLAYLARHYVLAFPWLSPQAERLSRMDLTFHDPFNASASRSRLSWGWSFCDLG